MHITCDDSERLVTVDFNWLTALGFAVVGPCGAVSIMADRSSRWNDYIAAAIIVVSLMGANQFATRIVFDFDRRSRKLTFTSSSLTRRRQSIISFADIQSAGVHMHLSDNMRLYRVELHTSIGTLPLSSSFSSASKDDLDAIAERINLITQEPPT